MKYMVCHGRNWQVAETSNPACNIIAISAIIIIIIIITKSK